MVSISRESADQTDQRLRRVIRLSRLKVYGVPYAFDEFPTTDFAFRADPHALALVRDDELFSQLRPATLNSAEPFCLWRFHFPQDADNSGFVGWLASHLKSRFGTGVFVVCGQNTSDGGIFDYWGAPWKLQGPVLDEIRSLCGKTSALP